MKHPERLGITAFLSLTLLAGMAAEFSTSFLLLDHPTMSRSITDLIIFLVVYCWIWKAACMLEIPKIFPHFKMLVITAIAFSFCGFNNTAIEDILLKKIIAGAIIFSYSIAIIFFTAWKPLSKRLVESKEEDIC